MQKHKIPKENIMVVVDDLNLEFGSIRMRDTVATVVTMV